MSHFTVLCVVGTVPIDEAEERVKQMLAPYDENEQVPEYRVYLSDKQAGRALAMVDLEAAEARVGPRPSNADLQAERDRLRARPLDDVPAHEEDSAWQDFSRRWREWVEADDAWEESVGRAFTADEVVDAYNAKYGDPEDEERYRVDPETGRVYYLTTYNPKSKWDWWSIGGRWSGQLRVREDALATAVLGEPGVFDNEPMHSNGRDIALVGDVENLADLPDGVFAALTPEGWEEKGSMGWWGIVSDEKPETDWRDHVREILAGLPPSCVIAMVDCHI